MKSKTSKNLTGADKLQSEYEALQNKYGKNHSKSIFMGEIVEFQKNIDFAKNKIPEKDFKKIIPQLPRGIDFVLDTKNFDKRYETYYGTLNQVVSQIFQNDYTTEQIVAAATLFIYLVDCGYSKENHFKNETVSSFFDEATTTSTGEFLIYSGLDSKMGLFKFYQKLLEKGLSLLEDLLYPKIIMVNDEPYIEIVGIKESNIIPYHLFNNNSKDFAKRLKMPENRISTSSFINFAPEIEKVKNGVVQAVEKFWDITKVLEDYRVLQFKNLLTLESLHNLCAQYLDTEFTDKKCPILKIRNKHISVRKLMEFILLKNNVSYLLNPDLIYQDQYYIKMEFDSQTMVKWTYFNMLDDEFSLVDIRGYVSSNAFSKSTLINEEAPKLIQKLDAELPDFIPDSAQDVILRANEDKSKEFFESVARSVEAERKLEDMPSPQTVNRTFEVEPPKESNWEMKENISQKPALDEVDDFENTTSVNLHQAQLEEQELLKQSQQELPQEPQQDTRLKDNFYINEEEYKEIKKNREIEKAEIDARRKERLMNEVSSFAEAESVVERPTTEVAEDEKAQDDNDLVNFDVDKLFNESSMANSATKNYDANDSFFKNVSGLLTPKTTSNKVEENQLPDIEENIENVEEEAETEEIGQEEIIEPIENEKEIENSIEVDEKEKIAQAPIEMPTAPFEAEQHKVDFNDVDLETNEVEFDFLNDATPIYPDYDNKPLYPMQDAPQNIEMNKEKLQEESIEELVERAVEKRLAQMPKEKVVEKIVEIPKEVIVEKIVEVPKETVAKKPVEKAVEAPQKRVVEEEPEIIDNFGNFKFTQPMGLPPIPPRKNQNTALPTIPPRRKQ